MLTVKQGTINQIAIGIADGTGAGVTGLPYTAVSISIAKAGAAAAAKVLAPGDWAEIGQGWYWVTLSAADTDTLGPAILLTTYASASGAYDLEVVANLEADTVALLGAPAGASLAADVAAVKGDTAAVKAKTDNLPVNPASQGDVATVGTAVAAVDTKLGVPVDVSVSADIATVQAAVTSLSTLLGIIRGLMGADSYEDNFVYDGPSGALGSSRLRTYNSAANAAAHGATGLLKTYTMTFGYTGTDLSSVQITEA